MKKMLLFLGYNLILGFPFLMAMERVTVALEDEESNPAVNTEIKKQSSSTPQAPKPIASEYSASALISTIGKKTLDFAKENPIAVVAGAFTMIALPVAIYLYRQPSFSYNDSKYKNFYTNSLTQLQRKNPRYSQLLLKSENPFILLKHMDFLGSLTVDQNIELLFVLKNYCEQRSKQLSLLKSTELSEAESNLNLCKNLMSAFEKIIISGLSLLPFKSEFIEAYNKHYSDMGTNIQCCSNAFSLSFPSIAHCCSYAGQKFIAALANNLVYVWDTLTGKCLMLVNIDVSSKISNLYIDSLGIKLAAITNSGEICIYSLQEQKIESRWTYRQDGAITTLTFNNDSTTVITGTTRGIMKIWDCSSGKLLKSQQLKLAKEILSIRVDGSGRIFILSNEQIHIWDSASSNENANESVKTIANNVQALLLFDDSYLIKDHDAIKVYDSTTNESNLTIPIDTPLLYLFGSNQFDFFAIVRPQGTIEIWYYKTGECVCKFNSDLSDNITLSFGQSPDKILGISREQNSLVLRSWKWQIPQHTLESISSVIAANKWAPIFDFLKQTFSKDELQTIASPHELVDKEEFKKHIPASLRPLFLEMLQEYLSHYFEKEVEAILGDNPDNKLLKVVLSPATIKLANISDQQRMALTQLHSKIEDCKSKQKIFETIKL